MWLPIHPSLMPESAWMALPIYVVSLPSKVRVSEHISNDWRAIDPHSIHRCFSLPLIRVPTACAFDVDVEAHS